MASQSIELSDLFDSVVTSLRNDQPYLNDLDRMGGNGNHGDNVVDNFERVQQVLRANRDAPPSSQLNRAAEALRQQGRGATAPLYAQGLEQAARDLEGRNSFDAESMLPFLQALLGGVQQASGAQPGEGTLLDALVPGVMGYLQARGAGQDNGQAILQALGAASRGSRQLQQRPALYGNSRRSQQQQPWMDPGAASATSMLEGLFRVLMSGR